MQTTLLYKQLLLILFTLGLFTSAYSQVTIGSASEPNIGALLDLKEYNDNVAKLGGRTATKGLGLPRVALRDLKTLLVAPDSEAAESVGMIVYNTTDEIPEPDPTNPCAPMPDLNSDLAAGVMVWDGSQWQYLFPPAIEEGPAGPPSWMHPSVKIMYDVEKNAYTYKKFGDTYWMTQNLRTKTYPNGEKLNLVHSNPADGETRFYGYPRSKVNMSILDPSEYNEKKDLGLIYTKFAMAGLKNTSVVPAKHQGICPDGWYLPSDTDWASLISYLNNNLDEVAVYAPGETVYNAYTASIICGDYMAADNARSKSAAQGGFAIIPLGYADYYTLKITNNAVYEIAAIRPSKNEFGFVAGQSQDDSVNYFRKLEFIPFNNSLQSNLISLRCIRDTDPELD